jgi:hypothetical protein
MKKKKVDTAASVLALLLNRARQTGEEFQRLLTVFCYERFLYRLGKSKGRQRLILKGAMLLRLWSDRPCRTTRDLVLLRRGGGSLDDIRSDMEMICATEVEPDGIVFDPASLRIDEIRAEDEYGGVRVILPARCGSARLRLQIDIGLGDFVWPSPQSNEYPVLLDFPRPSILTYPPEAVVAEKFEAIIVLGERNSRIKDFFDLHYLAGRFEFDRAILAQAVGGVLTRRKTPVPSEEPVGLTSAYWENSIRTSQIRAFIKRAGLTSPSLSGDEILGVLRPFLLPILEDMRLGRTPVGIWTPGGPWR